MANTKAILKTLDQLTALLFPQPFTELPNDHRLTAIALCQETIANIRVLDLTDKTKAAQLQLLTHQQTGIIAKARRESASLDSSNELSRLFTQLLNQLATADPQALQRKLVHGRGPLFQATTCPGLLGDIKKGFKDKFFDAGTAQTICVQWKAFEAYLLPISFPFKIYLHSQHHPLNRMG